MLSNDSLRTNENEETFKNVQGAWYPKKRSWCLKTFRTQMRTWKHLRTPKAQVIERKAKAALLDEKEKWEMDFALKSIKKERKKKSIN